jgi:hypothetical protein
MSLFYLREDCDTAGLSTVAPFALDRLLAERIDVGGLANRLR